MVTGSGFDELSLPQNLEAGQKGRTILSSRRWPADASMVGKVLVKLAESGDRM